MANWRHPIHTNGRSANGMDAGIIENRTTARNTVKKLPPQIGKSVPPKKQ
jgi:hypothetical protein